MPGTGVVRDLWSTLVQSEIAVSLSAAALEVPIAADDGLYALHHPTSAWALRRLRAWEIAGAPTDRRPPWSVRQSPAVHGALLGALAPLGAAPLRSSGVSRSIDVLQAALGALVRSSVQRSLLVAARGAPAGFPDPIETTNRRILACAQHAAQWVAPSVAPMRHPLARSLGAARVVLAAELALAMRRVIERRIAIPARPHALLMSFGAAAPALFDPDELL